MSERQDFSMKLRQIAFQAILEEDFIPELPTEVLAEVEELQNISLAKLNSETLDLRNMLWSSIDNEDSRDLDQVEVAEQLENDEIRIRIGIADVDAFVPKNSETDIYAGQNTTSVYTGVQTFPMLPRALSEDLTSLLEGKDRFAIVTDFVVAKDGSVKLNGIYRALVHNHAKLDYDSVGDFLDGKTEFSIKFPELEEQILLQDEASDRLRAVRMKEGALEFGTVEATTVRRDGEIYLIVKEKTQARYLIENLMITANVLMAEFLEANKYPCLKRLVRRPERWQRIVQLAADLGEQLPGEPSSIALAEFLERRRAADPIHFPDLSLSVVKLIGAGDYTVYEPGKPETEGHFGLAVSDYTHSTAPNRRYADLITQRLVKAAIRNAPAPYSIEELEEIAARCNERQSAARKVERKMRKAIAAQVLSQRIGETFQGIVTGVSQKGVFVRLLDPPAEGKIVANEIGADVGDKVIVRLMKTDAENGFIDFERL
ncbi:MAG: RNB domain-containing ribonuclease [Acidobacteriota bacterium]|nr:RNB domain-containing ribonuclease [Acidobacteriota bacterium]